MIKLISRSPEDTQNIAKRIAKVLTPNSILCLYGDLGAGKTEFAKGLAESLGVQNHISSPTFTIVNEYSGNIPLYHFDVYRINTDEFLEIGGEEYFYKNGIIFIEWPQNIAAILPKERLEIYINYSDNNTENFNKREIIIKPLGKKYENILEELK